MHFHLPKPLHGWREFTGEVGIIVIGVMIALGAEQVVERIHDGNIAVETRRTIKAEFDSDLTSLALRSMAEPCIDRRLKTLRSIVADWETKGHFVTPQWVAQTPSLDLSLPRYEAAVSAGRLALLPSEEQYHIGAIANGIREFEKIQGDERIVWGRLRLLQAGSQALSTSDRTVILTALQDASTLDYLARIAVRQQLPFAKDAGYQPNFSEARRLARRVWTGGGYRPSICTSIDTPPDTANRTQVTPLPL
jgi:hypothetical protein